jgi:hypothetical protein
VQFVIGVCLSPGLSSPAVTHIILQTFFSWRVKKLQLEVAKKAKSQKQDDKRKELQDSERKEL